MWKVEKELFLLLFSLREKKGGSYLSCTGGWREQAVFLSCYNINQQRTVVWWWLLFGRVYVLVTKLPENSSAELICCYQSAQWHKQVSADHSALYTDGSWSVCIKVMAHNSFLFQHVDTCLTENAFVTCSPFHCVQLTMCELKRQGSIALIYCYNSI